MPSADPTEWVPVWQEWPVHDAWPMYYLGENAHHWRNGREGGAWLAGIVSGIPEKCAKVEIETEWIAGAVLAMIEGGLCIGPYARGDATTTYEVWVAHFAWGPERITGHEYAPPIAGLLVTPSTL